MNNKNEDKIRKFDGKDEIIYSESFNVYEDELTIKNLLGFNFVFKFENTEPKEGQKDITIKGEGESATLVFSKKFRNSLGAGTTEKLSIIKTKEGKDILFSIAGQQISGSKLLHIVVNFYLRQP